MKHLTLWYTTGWLGRRRRWTTGSGERKPVPRSAWEQPLQKIITGICKTISHKGKKYTLQTRQWKFNICLYQRFASSYEIPLRFQNKKEAWITWHMNHAFFVIFKRKKRHDHLFSNYALFNISTTQIWGPSTWKSRVAGFHLKVLWCLVFNAWLKYCAVWTCVTLYGWKSLYFEFTFKTAALF